MSNLTHTYRATPLAQVIHIGEQAVMLDLRAQEFLGLNAVSTELWRLLVEEGKTPQEVTRAMVERYEVDPQRVIDDLGSLIATMLQRRLLVRCHPLSHASEAPHAAMRRTPLEFLLLALAWLADDKLCKGSAPLEWLEACLCLRWVDWWLRGRGLQAFANRLAALPTSASVSWTDAEMQRLAARVASAANWQGFRAACLHQYLALCWMLRRRGLQVDFVIGVALYPFFAHAWLKSGPDAIQDAIHWHNGLGLDKSLEMLQDLAILFATDDTVRSGKGEAR
jgi:Transglutaminase-like superfamily/Coenzyme PQQ synthesis protein D (PqqD)